MFMGRGETIKLFDIILHLLYVIERTVNLFFKIRKPLQTHVGQHSPGGVYGYVQSGIPHCSSEHCTLPFCKKQDNNKIMFSHSNDLYHNSRLYQ